MKGLVLACLLAIFGGSLTRVLPRATEWQFPIPNDECHKESFEFTVASHLVDKCSVKYDTPGGGFIRRFIKAKSCTGDDFYYMYSKTMSRCFVIPTRENRVQPMKPDFF